MKRFYIFVAVFLFIGGLFSVNAADIIVLKDGTIIEAKIMEIYPAEIRYKRADNLNGQTVILPKDRVLSIKFEGGALEIVSVVPPAGQQPVAPAPSAQPAPTATAPAGQQSGQTGGAVSTAGSSAVQQPGAQTLLQTTLQTSLLTTLNGLPAITIAGNNLKFQFGADNWTASVNGENFFGGSIEVENTDGGSILNLKQTHMWPGAAAKTAGKLAGKVGGGVAGGALNKAGQVAAAAGPVEASGPVIVLEYKAGPPPKLSYLRSGTVTSAAPSSASASATLSEPVNIVLADAEWIPLTGAEIEATRKNTTMQFNIANEEIGGQVREVLTLETNLAKGSGWGWSQVTLSNETMVQTLQAGSGVRLKVLGDGKRWKFIIPTNEANKDGCNYEIPIVTKKGQVVAIDVPYSKLKQPAWGKKVRFIKSSINGLQIQRNSDIGGTGPSTIKVFDLEIY